MPNAIPSLMPYCPALPVLGSRLCPVSQGNLVPTAIELLEHNPAIVVSGRHRLDWDLNRRTGKTRTVENRLIPVLRDRGQAVSYLDVQKVVRSRDFYGFNVYDYAPLASRARAMPDADVYVLDEVQHAFPFKEEMRMRRLRREPYEDALMALWDRAAKVLERGGRLVLVSCVHPCDPVFEGCLYDSTMALFFSSPVLELGGL
jgi:hypothetical protein